MIAIPVICNLSFRSVAALRMYAEIVYGAEFGLPRIRRRAN